MGTESAAAPPVPEQSPSKRSFQTRSKSKSEQIEPLSARETPLIRDSAPGENESDAQAAVTLHLLTQAEIVTSLKVGDIVQVWYLLEEDAPGRLFEGNVKAISAFDRSVEVAFEDEVATFTQAEMAAKDFYIAKGPRNPALEEAIKRVILSEQTKRQGQVDEVIYLVDSNYPTPQKPSLESTSGIKPYEKEALAWLKLLEPVRSEETFQWDHQSSSIRISHLPICRMAPGTWINDDSVDFFLNHLVDEYKTLHPEEAAHCHLMPSSFAGSSSRPYEAGGLLWKWKGEKWSDTEKMKDCVLKLCGGTDTLFKDGETLVIPINLNNTHWSLGILFLAAPGVAPLFVHLDSLPATSTSGPGSTRGIAALLGEFLQAMAGEQELAAPHPVRVDSCKQDNGFDCGIFLCQYGKQFLRAGALTRLKGVASAEAEKGSYVCLTSFNPVAFEQEKITSLRCEIAEMMILGMLAQAGYNLFSLLQGEVSAGMEAGRLALEELLRIIGDIKGSEPLVARWRASDNTPGQEGRRPRWAHSTLGAPASGGDSMEEAGPSNTLSSRRGDDQAGPSKAPTSPTTTLETPVKRKRSPEPEVVQKRSRARGNAVGIAYSVPCAKEAWCILRPEHKGPCNSKPYYTGNNFPVIQGNPWMKKRAVIKAPSKLHNIGQRGANVAGARALKEIRLFQKNTGICMSRAGFQRILKMVCNSHGLTSLRERCQWSAEATLALQLAAEDYLVGFLSDCNRLALHAKRITLKVKDMDLLKELRQQIDHCYAKM